VNTLSNISFEEPIIKPIRLWTQEQIIAMYEKSIEIGHEELVLSDLDTRNNPGEKCRHWIKLKKGIEYY
jgi:ATP-dependent DNA ligase